MRVAPACGAALAVACRDLPVLQRFRRPLFIVRGGIGVDLATLTSWKQRFGLQAGAGAPRCLIHPTDRRSLAAV